MPKIKYKEFIEENFKILDKDTQLPVPFKLNPAQDKYYKLLQQDCPDLEGVRELLLKARQEGMCLSPHSKVLLATLEWVELKDIKVGEEIIAVDEYSPIGKGMARKMQTAIIEATNVVYKDAFCVTMDDGRKLIATAEHRFLMRNNTKCIWKSIGESKIGDEIRYITTPWENTTLDDAWFGGVLDGEGTLRKKERAGTELSVCQTEGKVWDKILNYANKSKMQFRIDWDRREAGINSKLGNKPLGRVVFGRMNEIFEILGKTRPVRFIGRRFWEGKELPGKRSGKAWSRIVSIESLGVQKMIDLQTSEKTFIVEGFVSHNSSFILALFTVDFIMIPYSVNICIAHRKADTETLFRKVKFYLDSYCVKHGFDVNKYLKSDNKGLIESQEKNSVFFIGTAGSKVGSRGGSARNILFSECAFYQDTQLVTASEIVTATSQQVPQDHGMIFIESTANGEGNYYHAEWQRAVRKESSYTPRFFGWQEAYTKEWVEKKKGDFPSELLWKQEYPNDPDEAFITSGSPYFDKLVLKSFLDRHTQPTMKGRLSASGEWL